MIGVKKERSIPEKDVVKTDLGDFDARRLPYILYDILFRN